MCRRCWIPLVAAFAVGSIWIAGSSVADAPIGGFIPFVGFGLTDQFENSESGSATFFLAEVSNSPEGSFLGTVAPHFEIGLLDSGAATHIVTSEAYDAFDILGAGFDGTEIQQVGGATGLMYLEINDPLSIYVAGLGNRVSAGSTFEMNTSVMRGQTSVATLAAPPEWQLPNIIGLPLAAQHAISIRNDTPQIFEYQGRTVRTPNISLLDLGSGGIGQGLGDSDILRRASIQLQPGIGFIQGPIYVYNTLNILYGQPLHENPQSPSVIENGALFVDVDLTNMGESLQDIGFVFDTGADMTVICEQTAVRLGFDPILDTPDFMLEVEGSGGVIEGIPGFYIDTLDIDTVGGSFSLTNVPVAVLDVTNPSDPGNVVDGILGTHLFVDRNIVIDANPSIGQGGVGPSLYISDPVTETHAWATTAATGNWQAAGNWNAPGTPGPLWVVNLIPTSGSNQQAVVEANSQVFRVNLSGSGGAAMDLRVQSGATLLVFSGVTVSNGADLIIESDAKVDAQFIQLEDGSTLSGHGSIFVGAGPINGQVRNLSGMVAPGDQAGNKIGTLAIQGDFSNRPNGTLAIDLGGTLAGTQFDQLQIDGAAYLGGALDVTLVDSGSGLFDPEIGDLFEILTATDGISGEFELMDLPSSITWDIHYTANTVTLEVLALIGLPADFNNDGAVDSADLTAWQTGFGTQTGATRSQGDADGDGDVDGADFLAWQGSFGTGSASAGISQTAIPEPCTFLLAVLLLGSLLRFRKVFAG
ncbi:MAG: retropepsin-like domain-containing protein [Pirellulales bacterium]|nr:retropepsin-like domain-containing protein [Pirellulales bacterium]